MRKIYVLIIAFAISFISCSDEQQEEQVIPTSPKTYTVSLGVKGEILDVIQTPLTKSEENNDLYGIQVYVKTHPNSEYTPYAYGLFDNIKNITLTLIDDYYYKFVCSMVVNGKKVIKSQINSDVQTTYSAPFSGSVKVSDMGYNLGYYTPISNRFRIVTDSSFSNLKGGFADLAKLPDNNGLNHPNTDRYYGEVSNFRQTANSTVNIEMKRTVFGVNFIAEGLTEGKLRIHIYEAPELYIYATDSKHEVEDIFVFTWVDAAFKSDRYTEDIKTSIYWEKDDGTEMPIALNYPLTFTRKMMHTVRIKLAGTSTKGESPISITLEDGTLSTGKDYTVGETQN